MIVGCGAGFWRGLGAGRHGSVDHLDAARADAMNLHDGALGASPSKVGRICGHSVVTIPAKTSSISNAMTCNMEK
jgi:hypothetical protein